MKKFALICENKHEFEGWFQNADAVQSQAKSGLIDCPFCGSLHVQKQLSAPNLSSPKTKARITAADMQDKGEETPLSTGTSSGVSSGVSSGTSSGAVMPGQPTAMAGAAYHTALRHAVQQLRKRVEAEFTDVGSDFAEKAREIHYGESEETNIYGSCTRQETEELLEEGVEILPLPELPPEQ